MEQRNPASDAKKGRLDKRILIFLALTFVLTWGLLTVSLSFGVTYGTMTNTLIFSLCMLMPAISSLLTRLVTKEGFSDMLLRPRLKDKKNLGAYALAWFLPAALIFAGAAIFYLVVPGSFDPTFAPVVALIGDQNISVATVVLLQAGQALLLAPVLNIVFTLGEELGWRGYLLPHLLKETTPRRAILTSGLIWGLWHSPMIAMGHNFGVGYWGYPFTGVILMTVFCVFFGAILSYVTLKTKSVIPAAVGHGALNGIAALVAFANTGAISPLLGPYAMSLIPLVTTVIAGVICWKKAEQIAAAPETESEPQMGA